jgi:hypothetical protein
MAMKRFVAGLVCMASFAQAAESPRTHGIAAGYPGDRGIENDSAVVFVENFEEKTLEDLWKRWETVTDRSGMSFSSDVPANSAGRQSLVMDRTSGSGSHLYRRLKNKSGGWGYEQLFARYYVKFDPDCGEIHHFGTCLGGNNPPTPWPSVG